MTTGFTVNGVDLDDWFDPYVQGDKPGLTGYKVGAQDLRDRYAPRVFGIQAPVTGFVVDGVGDLNVLFAKKGTAVYEQVVSDPGYPPLTHFYGVQNPSGTVEAFGTLSLASDGTYTSQTGDTGTSGDILTGDWFAPPRAGAGDDYQIKFTFTATHDDGATISNGAANWTALTATRTWHASISAPSFNSTNKSVTGDLRVQIRRASDGVVLSDRSISVNLALRYV